MVSTRRSSAIATAAAAAAVRATKPSTIRSTNTTSVLLKPDRQRSMENPVTPTSFTGSNNAVSLDSVGQQESSLTSPSTGIPQLSTGSILKQAVFPKDTSIHLSSSPLRNTLAEAMDPNGTALNPIILGNSPNSHPIQLTKEEKHRNAEPHKFIARGYRDIYNYRTSCPVLAPKAANGSTFTGDQSQDIYRMMNAKLGLEEDIPKRLYKETDQMPPFVVQHPKSAEYLAQRFSKLDQLPLLQVQNHNYTTSSHLYPMLPSKSEEMLRRKALQYIQEFSRPCARKRKLSDLDLHETNSSEPKQAAQTVNGSSTKPRLYSTKTSLTSHSNSAALPVPDRRSMYHESKSVSSIDHLIELTSLLTSLLQVYPASTDQIGLHDDIAKLLSIQNQQMEQWSKLSTQPPTKHRKPTSDSSTRTSTRNKANANAIHTTQNIAAAEVTAQDQDNQVRQFLSATADLWQNGAKQRLPDVFAAPPSS